MAKVLLLESLHPSARAALDGGAQVVALEQPDAPVDDAVLREVEAIVTRGRGQVDAGLLARCPALRVVTRAGVGLDNVDRAAAAARGVAVVHVPDALTETVSEHALALALAARREVVSSARAAREGRWEERDRFTGESLAGSRVTVVGLGAIGERTRALMVALGAEVTAWNRSAREVDGFEPDLARALTGAEVVTLHVALDDGTRGLMDTDRLALLAPGAVVVNTARPGVVEAGAMLAALEAEHVAAYAVDGFHPEPPPADDPLLRHPGVIVTPHVAALTGRTYAALCAAAVTGTLDVLDGRAPGGGARLAPRP